MNKTTANTQLSNTRNILRLYLLRPKVILPIIIVFCFLFCMHYVNTNMSHTEQSKPDVKLIIPKIHITEQKSWEINKMKIGIYSGQGRRPTMEDRYVINENIENTGISFFGLFDGHSGPVAVEFVKTVLVQNVFKKIIEVSNILKNQRDTGLPIIIDTNECGIKDNYDLKYGFWFNEQNKSYDGKCYIDDGQINFGKLLVDEILAAEYIFNRDAMKIRDMSGSTLLMALIDGTRLVIANVGDSRCVMSNKNWKPVQLTTDHKPNEIKELYRIRQAGGKINLDNGVWRVDGIATTRTLGDYILKQMKRIIPNPDIFSRDLIEDKPKFLILASDGLWDRVSTTEAGEDVKRYLNRSDLGAEELAKKSYSRGTGDNITVLVILFQ